jgi:hypothetical protein
MELSRRGDASSAAEVAAAEPPPQASRPSRRGSVSMIRRSSSALVDAVFGKETMHIGGPRLAHPVPPRDRACSSIDGFHCGSVMSTTDAAWMLRPTPPASIWLTRTRGRRSREVVYEGRFVGDTLPVGGPIATSPSSSAIKSSTRRKKEKTTTLRSFAVASSTMSTSRASFWLPFETPASPTCTSPLPAREQIQLGLRDGTTVDDGDGVVGTPCSSPPQAVATSTARATRTATAIGSASCQKRFPS